MLLRANTQEPESVMQYLEQGYRLAATLCGESSHQPREPTQSWDRNYREIEKPQDRHER